ncbi:MAG: methyl-accepting chemotaxis protein [bacterium]
MDIIKEEERIKGRDFSLKGSISTMAFCFLLEIIFILGHIFKFLVMPAIIPIIALAVFIFGFVLYSLLKKNIYSPAMPFLITAVTALLLSIALGYIDPVIRVPFFLIFFYIIIHPAVFLGRKNGLFAIVMVDLSYLVMILMTRSQYPWLDINLEILKLVLLTFIGLLLVSDFDKILQRIRAMRVAATKAEQGDLTVEITDNETDELSFLARSYNRIIQSEAELIRLVKNIVDSLIDMSQQIASTADEMAGASSEIVHTTQKMTEGINEQYNELDRTITIGKNLSEVSFEVVSNVKKIEEFSFGVSDSASSAIGQSEVIINNIELIGKRYDYLTTLMTKVQEISLAINKIVNTIDAIAEKINILSLNASIEAARAGEYGRGFSIVADEIKKLADSSQESASEIGRIIKEMMASIKTVTESTEEVNTAISDGSIVVKSTADAMKVISNNVIELNSAIKNINEMIAKEEEEITNIIKQVEGSHSISRDNSAAAEQILASIQEQSAAAQEFTATSQELVIVSTRLKEMVKKFNVDKTE